MKKELNIAAILKEKPKGTKLYSKPFGDCIFDNVANDDNIRFTMRSDVFYTDGYGKYSPNGECLVFPSKQMQDWSKFAWKKGDVLLCGVDNCCIFKEWDNGEYTEFKAEFVTPNYSSAILKTKDWSKVTREDTIKQYISNIEEIKGGKLNLETLEIEHPKQEFKDGDILHSDETRYSDETIFIAKISEGIIGTYAYLDKLDDTIMVRCDAFEESEIDTIRQATEEEKQQLFSALEKENKRWNPDTKQIEDLPKKCKFKVFQQALVRDLITEKWKPALFVRMREDDNSEYIYKCLSLETAESCCFRYCIPYNEETKHLLGTTDEWKGGEG